MSNPGVSSSTEPHVETSSMPGYSQYHNSPTLSDITIRYSDRTFYGHKIVLVSNSQWFKNALTKQFLESSKREIKLHEDKPAVLEGMFAFMYGVDIAIPARDQTPLGAIMFCLQLFVVADKYEYKPLMAAIPGMVDTWLSKLVADLAAASPENAEEIFTQVVEAMYELDIEGGRAIKQKVLERLFAEPETDPLELSASLAPMVTEVARGIPEFGRDMFLAMMGRKGEKKTGGPGWNKWPGWFKVVGVRCTRCRTLAARPQVGGDGWVCDTCGSHN